MRLVVGSALASLMLVGPVMAEDTEIIQTQAGPVQGFVNEFGNDVFLGIPFAAPPTGDLRWHSPVDPQPWTNTLAALEYGDKCLQLASGEDGVSTPVGSEDCLYLNVWRPSEPSDEPLPVMVWIHGGGNTVGSADLSIYDGSHIAEQGNVIVVTIQYRMHYLGYFNNPNIYLNDAVEDSGNYGLLDQLKSLEWVQENAEAFGGDPDRVTVFGESAGGVNTWAVMLSDMGEGLFHRTIIESGCLDFIHLDTAKKRSEDLIEVLVVGDGLATAESAADYVESQGEAWVRDYIYGKDASDMLLAFSEAGLISMTDYYPIQDGTVFPTDALQKVEVGDYNRVPSIIGANADESKLFMFPFNGMGPIMYNGFIDSLYGEEADTINKLYPSRDYTEAISYNRAVDVADSYLELMCGDNAAMKAAPWQDVWLYKFKYDDFTEPYDVWFGASHAMELPFVFNVFSNDALYPEDTIEARDALSAAMITSWSCMAHTGDPTSCSGATPWPKLLDGAGNNYSRLLWDSPISTDQISRSELDKMDYWQSQGGLEDPGPSLTGEASAYRDMIDLLSP